MVKPIISRALISRALISRALIPRALIPRALIPRALIPRALIPRALIPRAFIPVVGALVVSALGACGSFQDPNVVVDLRVLGISSDPADQVVDVDLTNPDPQAVVAQLVPFQVCALIADPGASRALIWSASACERGDSASGERCATANTSDTTIQLGSGTIPDPDTSVPEPSLCFTVEPNAAFLNLLFTIAQDDDLRGVGGIDANLVLQIGGADTTDRSNDIFATKILRVSPRIPAALTANHNPSIDRIDTRPTATATAPETPLPLLRCAENPSPPTLAAGQKLRLTPVEPDGVRETYATPTLDGSSQTFTETLTYQWTVSAGKLSRGKSGGPHDLAGNPAPLFTDFTAPSAKDLDLPANISLWVVQRDERLGVHWYESCIRVTP